MREGGVFGPAEPNERRSVLLSSLLGYIWEESRWGGDTLDAGGEGWLLDVEFGGGMSCASAQLL